MKYVLLGTLSYEWATKQSDRVSKARGKLEKLGIKLESIYYTQGPFDFVDVVDAPNPEAMLAFSIWYAAQGLGRIQTMPAFDVQSFEAAAKEAATARPIGSGGFRRAGRAGARAARSEHRAFLPTGHGETMEGVAVR